MIVEMIAAEIGEARRIEAHAVEAALVDPVGGRLHGKARHAIVRARRSRVSCREIGIGRRQRAVGCAVRRDDAERADARRLVAQMREELAREIGDRALAARSGDGDDLVRAGADRSATRRERASGARRSPAHRRHDRAGPRVVPPRRRRRAAPAATACGTKLMPSTFVPGTAKNRVPVLDLAAVGCDASKRKARPPAGPAPRRTDRRDAWRPRSSIACPRRRGATSAGRAAPAARSAAARRAAARRARSMLPVTGPAFQPAVEKP